MNSILRKIYLDKIYLQLLKGVIRGQIVPFDDDFYKSMSTTYLNCIPISMHIKYLKPNSFQGKCIDRSLYMFFCFEESVLVRGDNKSLEIRYGKDHAEHGWIEMGDYVYDPSSLLRYKKDLYYKIYKISNVSKITRDEYKKNNGTIYDEIKSIKLEDFQVGGKRRVDLAITIPLIKAIAEKSPNDFKIELEEYLKKIGYDESEVYYELCTNLEANLRNNKQKKFGNV